MSGGSPNGVTHSNHIDSDPANGISNAPNAGTSAGGGMSSTAPARGQQYIADKEDLLDQHVAYYLRHNPEVHLRNLLTRKRPGVYELNSREVLVEWQYATEPGGQGFLVVLDGPLRQPFSDYMEMNEVNAEYDTKDIIARSALQMIPKEKRMSFGDSKQVYTRLEAMKVAKEQAVIRETAADCVKEGKTYAPEDLMKKYRKTIEQKLGPNRRTAPQPQNNGGAATSPPGPEGAPSPAAAPPPPQVPQPQAPAPQAPAPQPGPQAPVASAPQQAAPQPYGQPYGAAQPWPPQQPSYNGPPLASAPAAQPCAAQAWSGAPSLTPPQGLFHGGHATLAPSAPHPAAYQMQGNAAMSYGRWG